MLRTVMTRARRRPKRLAAAIAVAVAVMVTAAPVDAFPAASAEPAPVNYKPACDKPAARHAACLAIVDSDASGRALSPQAAPAVGLNPYNAADLQSAYGLTVASALLGGRQTIAIVDAYDDPTAEADLAVYREANHLAACTTGNGCFRKVDQRGGTDYPSADAQWAIEISLDLDMASAICPNCRLLLVEGDDEDLANLGIAVDEGVKLGADAVSNSYGAAEFADELAVAGSHYKHPGVAIVASSGDSGALSTLVPAALSTVLAVGGTSLYRDGSARGWNETAWGGAGSGCSPVVPKPSWQTDRLCAKRTIADVSAVADPHTPVLFYDTFGVPGWVYGGGTSVAAPIIAGVYALAGNTATTNTTAYPYAHHRSLFDVTAGSNGACDGGYLCNAQKGYDGPTGNGTPNGIGGF
ncbi:S8 family serine peptidase [Kribbella sp. NBC_00709]|uniref:S53 family peptidase n=1 Tax=Kribbella sp. NBC_00709 TaxID=2975972 RepID=UPI002E2A3FB7|nr:S8 family serine peptidase [Kribbella sp. NBC_00709]